VPLIGPFIAALWAGLSRILATRAGQWIATALAALGISFVTTEAVLDPVLSMVASSFGGLPGSVAQWVGVLNFDKYVSIILSAYAAGGIKRAIMTRRAA
jgi:hypothetical protein